MKNKQVVELFEEFKTYHDKGTPFMSVSKYSIDNFLKEKGLLEEEFEVGKWYKYDGVADFLIFTTNHVSSSLYYGYGFDSTGEWSDYNEYGLSYCREATDKEVEEALIKEAKRLGHNHEVYNYDSDLNQLCGDINGYWHEVFNKGKWATIIEEEKEIFNPPMLQQVNDRLKAIEDKLEEINPTLN